MPPRPDPLVGRHPKRWEDMDRDERTKSIIALMALGHGATAIAQYHVTTRNAVLGTVFRARERGIDVATGRQGISAHRPPRPPRPRREREKHMDLTTSPPGAEEDFDPSEPPRKISLAPRRSKSLYTVRHSHPGNARPPRALDEEPPVAPDPAQAVDMAGLSDKVCAFPLWPNALNLRSLPPDEREAAVRYCGMPSNRGHYCQFHYKKMHEKTARQEFEAAQVEAEA